MIINLEQAIQSLKKHQPVAIPTETVYGLAATITDEEALRRVFEIKGRPLFDPLIVHVSSLEMARPLIQNMSDHFEKLAAAFWPGPFTIVSPKSNLVSDLITANLPSVGIRIPHHPVALELIEKLGVPVAAPSANKFKKTSPTSAQHVLDEFESKVPVLDGGECDVGIESTVVGLTDNQVHIYRPGKILKADIEKIVDCEVIETTSPAAPGQLREHYQPSVPFTLTSNPTDEMTELVLSKDPILAARELYAKLRELSKKGHPIYLDPKKYSNEGLWQSIWERIEKAVTKSL